ncbi:unnamed protein product [Scytosiphon promiscuus]
MEQVMLSVEPASEAAGSTSLSGNLAREREETRAFKTDSDHLENLGKMIEAMENTLRRDMDGMQIYPGSVKAKKGAVWFLFVLFPLARSRKSHRVWEHAKRRVSCSLEYTFKQDQTKVSVACYLCAA